MGKLKEEVFSIIQNFITNNKNKDEKVFISNLQKLINSLSLLKNKNLAFGPITEDMVIINTDGSSQGNPGKARIGIQIKDHLNNILLKEAKDIGIRTNNQAEYIAVIEALKIALNKEYKKAILYSDSEVIINQINNVYKTKNPKLKELYFQVKELEKKFVFIKFIHIKRDKNKEADILSR